MQKKRGTTGLIFVVLLVGIMVALGRYIVSLDQNVFESTEANHHEITTLQKHNFSKQMEAELMLLENVSSIFSSLDVDADEIATILDQVSHQSKFESVIVVGKDGIGLTAQGAIVGVGHRGYFKRAMNGKSCLGLPEPSSINPGKYVLPMIAPIIVNNKVAGACIGTYDVDALDKLLFTPFNKRGHTLIMNQQGKVIASTTNSFIKDGKENVFSRLSHVEFRKGYSLEKIQTSMDAHEKGCSRYVFNGSLCYVHYTPLDIEDWYVLSIMPETVVAERVSAISHNAALLAGAIILCFSLFIVYLNRLQKRHYNQIQKTAYYDDKTGLPNLAKFKLEMQQILEKKPLEQFSVVKFDIVNFKMINERFGVEVGDKLIETFGSLLGGTSRYEAGEVYARIYADEFIVLEQTDTIESSESNRLEFELIFEEATKGFLDGQQVLLRYGRYFIPRGDTDLDGCLEKANIAHRKAKKDESQRICDYDEAFRMMLMKESAMEQKMYQALVDGEFLMYLQPKYDLKTEQIVGAEALVRWQEAEGQLISPGEFIPLFERNGFVIHLDLYMLDKAAAFIRHCMDSGMRLVPVSVNFSRMHLKNTDFVAQISEIVRRHQIPFQYIEVELTESTIFENEDRLVSIFEELHDLGFTLSMDDFGSGYSSLGLLKNLPVDIIKIDRAFFSASIDNHKARQVIESTIDMAKKLSIRTVAEGVELEAHITLLREVGCDIVQGYYYSRPVCVQDYEQLILEK